jgi:outer membrane protein assembly factor BamB
MAPRPTTSRLTTTGAALAGGLALLTLQGCAGDGPELPKLGDLNPFKEKVTPLPGRRVSLVERDTQAPGEAAAPSTTPVLLPPVRVNDAWSQPGGEPTNAPGHLALGTTIKQAWSADIGQGSSSKGRLTASPVVADGRVYTLDADGQVTAFTASGAVTWRQKLVPESGAKGNGFGGGVAYDNGRLYGASGYGIVAAMDPATGKKLWEKNLGAPVRASPTASGDRVYIVTSHGRFFSLNGVDGSEMWAVRGLPQSASLVNNASPAVAGDTVVVPYPSGDLVALAIADGKTRWTETLTRSSASAQLSALTDAGRPAIDQGTVFGVGHAGRMVATQLKSGERQWTLSVAGFQTPWVAGQTVFVVDVTGQLMALSRTDGKVQWTTQLPAAKVWTGPTLAGGMLWLASSAGKLVAVDAVTGRVSGQLDVGNPVFIAPVVAQGRLYVLTDTARLVAFN